MKKELDISVIIVSWNIRDILDEALASIKQQTTGVQYEVIVVDNASHDGTVEMIQQKHPDVICIANKENRGFGAANNQGAAIAHGKVFAFINGDMRFESNILATALEVLQKQEKVGVLGFHLSFADGSHQDSVRGYPGIWDQLIILSKLHNFFPNLSSIRRYLGADTDYTVGQSVDQVMGACMFIPSDIFERAHGFDERFFVWFEEVDLQRRIHEMGYVTWYSPEATLIHYKGQSFGQLMPLRLQKIFNKSMRQYFQIHGTRFQWFLICILQPVSMLLALAVQLARSIGIHTHGYKRGQN